MKIIYIANARIPTEKAHGIQIMKMCEAFAKLGHEVRLIIPKRVSHISDEAFAFYGMKPSFEIVYLPSIDLISFSGLVPKVFSYLQNRTFARSVKNYLATNKPDLIHTRDELTAISLPPVCQIMLEIHNVSRILKSKARFLNSRITKFIVITNGLKRELINLGYSEGKIEILPDGVDLEMFSTPTSSPPIPFGTRGEKVVMYTGNFFAWKGVYTLAEAANNPHFISPSRGGEGEGVLFVFVGGSPYEQKQFSKYLTEHGLSNIKLIGHVAHNLIPKYLAVADVLVLPNSGKADISKYYTSPMKLFEYMAARKPIVASDLPSIREILNEQNSILVRPDDPQALAEGIKKAFSDEAVSCAERSFQDVRQYTWDIRAKKIIDSLRG